jgi:hypothetical protein
MAYTYPNKIKLARAEALAKTDLSKTVHEHYVAIGGLVIGDASEEDVVEAPKKEEKEEEVKEEKEEKPKKGKK